MLLINILGHDNREDQPTEVLLMVADGNQGRSRPHKHEGDEVVKWGSLRKLLCERAWIGKFQDL